MSWSLETPQGAESKKVMWELVPYTRGFGLDIGCGPYKAFPHFIGVDNKIDTQIFGIQMNPDFTIPDAKELPFKDVACDFVFSSHLLEHVEDYKACLKEWWRVLKVGGRLCLYLPHKNFYPNCGDTKEWKEWYEQNKENYESAFAATKDFAKVREAKGFKTIGEQYAGSPACNPDHKHDFLPKDIIEAMREFPSWDLLENQERNLDDEYSFFQVYLKTDFGKQRQPWTSPKPKKTAAITRFGAFGDLIQTASIAAALKAEGYHVTLFCETRGYAIAKSDPSYDRFIIQDKDQVPNQQLGPFWDYWRKKFDRWINLSESVEGSCLAMPDRINGQWPHEMRQKHMSMNYLEFMHDIAGTPYKWFLKDQKFVPTKDEEIWALEQKLKYPGVVILYALSGSAVHKVWPWMDQTFARLLTATDATIITVGDEKGVMLEAGWSKEARVICQAGKWTIRQSLAFSQVADIVMGPETGVVNCSAFNENVAKIVFLSHSSHNNLTRDWKNTIALAPENTPCYPCHKMIYSWDQCNQAKDLEGKGEGVALCAKNITPDMAWQALCQVIGEEHFTMPEKRFA
jgi:ADP-heptose:LPS heptosyltransferase/predicted SAM-dependent methyltransferase